MKARPHYLLYSESSETGETGRWRFVLRTTDGTVQLAADDVEPGIRGERLELLTVVRGLEALEQPSRVTLLTPSSYICEGIRYGIAEWRRNGWCWEWFGQMVPVKHRDLWQRVDRALGIHRVECRTWRVDRSHEPKHALSGPHYRHNEMPGSRVSEGATPRKCWHGRGTRSGRLSRLRDLWWRIGGRQSPWWSVGGLGRLFGSEKVSGTNAQRAS